jgi:hypothetical protein
MAKTDSDLALEADAGMHGQGAIVVMMARLKDAIAALDHTTTTLSRWLLAFTVAMFALTSAQIWLSIRSIANQVTNSVRPLSPTGVPAANGQAIGLAVGVVLGFIASLAAALLYDRAGRPKLTTLPDANRAVASQGAAAPHEFYHLTIRQEPSPWFYPAGRRPAWDCKAMIEVIDESGVSILSEPIIARWASQPEPLIPTIHQGQALSLIDLARLMQARRVNVHSHEDQPLSIAIKYEGSPDCHLFSNESYSFPQWQNPSWKLGPGLHRLRITVFYERGRLVRYFRLQNCGTGHGDIAVRPETA